MPSGNEEHQSQAPLKRKAWLAVFLGSALFLGHCGTVDLEILGLMMIVASRSRPVAPKKPPQEKTPTGNKDKVKIPDSWNLTPEQRDFIDSFDQGDDKNKK